jgi:hypothetical protein
MTEEHERRISHRELSLLAFKCKTCQVEFSIDLANDEQVRKLFESNVAWVACSFCGTLFDSALRGSLEWRQRLADARTEIIFRLPGPN